MTERVAASTFQEFIEQTQQEHAHTERELREIGVLINQSQAEVSRLAQQHAQQTNALHQLQANFDTTPREYIREQYEAFQDTQQRLFTMRGQLEKLQSDKENLDRLVHYQEEVIAFAEEAGMLMPNGSSGGRRRNQDQSNIVRVIQTEESARQSLVRKMHDGPASSLSNFILQAEICQRLFESDPSQAKTELDSLKNAAASTFSTVKDFIFDLRPMMLDDLGVMPTIRSYVNSFQDKSGGIPVHMNVTGTERRLESHIEVTIFRAVQELMNNARMHGRATQLQLQIDIGQEELTAVVEDNGSGFNVNEVLVENSRKTIGLPTLKERIEMLGGTLKMQSDIGQGTRAEFKLPIHDAF